MGAGVAGWCLAWKKAVMRRYGRRHKRKPRARNGPTLGFTIWKRADNYFHWNPERTESPNFPTTQEGNWDFQFWFIHFSSESLFSWKTPVAFAGWIFMPAFLPTPCAFSSRSFPLRAPNYCCKIILLLGIYDTSTLWRSSIRYFDCKKLTVVDFPGSPWVKMPCFQCRTVQVQTLVRELRFHMPHSQKKKKKFKKQPLFLDLCCYLWTYRVSILIEMSRVPVSIYTFVPQLVVPRTQVKDAVF